MSVSSVKTRIAGRLMSRQPVTVTPDMTLEDVARILSEHHITGVPVVDSQGALVGVISASDLARQTPDRGHLAGFYQHADHPPAYAPPVRSRRTKQVAEAMTRLVMSVEEGDDLHKVMDLMLKFRVHRVLVTRQGKPVGVISALDLVQLFQDCLNS